MNIRANTRSALLCLFFVAATLPLQAQPPTPPGETNRNLVERLAALEARVGKLESGQFTEDELVGTYAAFLFGINMLGSPLRNQAIVGVETATWFVTLDPGGTGSVTGSFGSQQLWEGTPWSHVASNESGSESLTWEVASGMLVITFANGEDGSLAIGAGGRVLIGSGFSGMDGSGWSVVITAIRLPDE